MHVNHPENLADHEESSILVTVPPSTTSPSISPLKCGEVRDQMGDSFDRGTYNERAISSFMTSFAPARMRRTRVSV